MKQFVIDGEDHVLAIDGFPILMPVTRFNRNIITPLRFALLGHADFTRIRIGGGDG